MNPVSTPPREVRRYAILGVLGEGGFGKVYRARLEGPDGFTKDVAVKLLREDVDAPIGVLRRFRDEARILGLIRDRAIVGVDPPIRLGGRWAVVMEFVEGASAAALLRLGAFPTGVAVEVVGEVARALDKMQHQAGPDGQPLKLLHRDLKPQNLQITPSGEVKVLDFGVARAEFANREAKTTQHIGGTPGYIAPERIEGEESSSGDIYSLGVVLHELLQGRRPAGQHKPTGATDPAAQALDLAGQCRSLNPDDRPSARDVERRCRELRGLAPPPFLREWAEERSRQLPKDEATDSLVGSVLTETIETEPSSLDTTTLDLPLASVNATKVAEKTPPAPATASRAPLALAAGVVVVGVVGLLGLFAVTGVLVPVVWLYHTSQETDAPLVEPEPLPDVPPAPDVPPPPAPRVALADGQLSVDGHPVGNAASVCATPATCGALTTAVAASVAHNDDHHIQLAVSGATPWPELVAVVSGITAGDSTGIALQVDGADPIEVASSHADPDLRVRVRVLAHPVAGGATWVDAFASVLGGTTCDVLPDDAEAHRCRAAFGATGVPATGWLACPPATDAPSWASPLSTVNADDVVFAVAGPADASVAAVAPVLAAVRDASATPQLEVSTGSSETTPVCGAYRLPADLLGLRDDAVGAGVTLPVDAVGAVSELPPAPPISHVSFRSDAPGATVAVDDLDRGPLPVTVDLIDGPHHVRAGTDEATDHAILVATPTPSWTFSPPDSWAGPAN